jgi:hypothetical protein
VLRKLCRIVVIVALTLAVIAAIVYWVLPIAISIRMAKTAPPIARLVPHELSDSSLPSAPGQKTSYFGYEFEVPWTDLDPTQTKSYPKDKPNKVVLVFHSGLRLSFTAAPARGWINGLVFDSSPQAFQAMFGVDATRSDYAFLKRLYEFTPDKMNCWSLSPWVHVRQGMLLTIKSSSLLSWAKGGIFSIENREYKGFQQGDPRVRPTGIAINLYSDDGGVEFIVDQKNYRNPAGVLQPELNRLVQSLRKAPQATASNAAVASAEKSSSRR